jgi:NAD(P)H-hydrate epimerase
MENEIGAHPYELIKIPYEFSDWKDMVELINLGSASFIGPGIGRTNETVDLLKKLLPHISVPTVLDADALSILAEEKIKIPEKSILTPHHGEMARLLGLQKIESISPDLLRLCQAYAEENTITLVLKGGPTFIFHPNTPIHISSSGDPGMATAGTGDILTGLIAALLAQKLEPQHAAYLGVYLHGLAGEHAVQEKTPHCMIASDLFHYFPAAFAFEAS